jgi:pantothenate kinase
VGARLSTSSSPSWLADRAASFPRASGSRRSRGRRRSGRGQVDDHLGVALRARLGLRDRKGAPRTFDVDGYVSALQRLRDDPERTLYVPGFERDLEQPIAAAIAIPPSARVVVTEGNYLLLPDGGWERVRLLLAETWFVEVDDNVRRDRLVRRHEEFGKSAEAARAWVESVDEPNAALVASTREDADLIVNLDSLDG